MFHTRKIIYFSYRTALYLMTPHQLVKLLFHRDIVMPVASLVFFYFTFLGMKGYQAKLTDLDTYAGVYVGCDSVVVKVSDKPLFKQVTKRLYIRLENSPYNFTILTTGNFGYITSQLKQGDTISIYTKSDREWIRRTNEVSINHLVYRDNVIVDFDRTFAVTPALILVCLVPALGFLMWYYIIIQKRLKEIKTT